MKKFLLIGAVLMVGASIYGFVDYNKAKHNRKFNELYNESETRKAESASQPATDESKVSSNEKTEITKETLKNSNVSKPAVVKTPVKQKIQKPRKVSYKEFSRAPLKEVRIEKAIKTEEPKKESMKTKTREL